ncbi:MAG: hypothetical protein R3F55_24340 [Alphaproteobacteria bacterium]
MAGLTIGLTGAAAIAVAAVVMLALRHRRAANAHATAPARAETAPDAAALREAIAAQAEALAGIVAVQRQPDPPHALSRARLAELTRLHDEAKAFLARPIVAAGAGAARAAERLAEAERWAARLRHAALAELAAPILAQCNERHRDAVRRTELAAARRIAIVEAGQRAAAAEPRVAQVR